MSALPREGRLRVRSDDGTHELRYDGEVVGRIGGGEVEVGDLDAVLEPAGTRRVLRSGRADVLRLDPGGRKATTLTLHRSRYRLSRQKWLPGRRQWLLTDGVAGDVVLRVTSTPLGTSVAIDAPERLRDSDLDALVAGALVVALGE